MPSELIVGVTGGIAAFKTAALVSSLVQEGHSVSVVMTRSARKFVGPATFRALTGRPVASDVFERGHFPLGAAWAEADVAAAAEQMLSVVESPEQAAARAEAGRRKAESTYSIEPVARRLNEEMTRVLEQLESFYRDPRYRPSPWLKRRAMLGLSLTTPDGV